MTLSTRDIIPRDPVTGEIDWGDEGPPPEWRGRLAKPDAPSMMRVLAIAYLRMVVVAAGIFALWFLFIR